MDDKLFIKKKKKKKEYNSVINKKEKNRDDFERWVKKYSLFIDISDIINS